MEPRGTLTEQLDEPVEEFLAGVAVNIQVSGADRRSHSAGLLSGGQPSVEFGFRGLILCEFPISVRDLVDVTPGQRPYRVITGNHLGDEILQFSRAFVVRHQPDTYFWQGGILRNYRTIGFWTWREIDVYPLKCGCYFFPAFSHIGVGVYQNSDNFPAINFQLLGDRFDQFLAVDFFRN